jgi:hypothetical protein
MQGFFRSRIAIATAAGIMGATVAAIAFDPTPPETALAQTDNGVPSVIQTPPAVPGIDYTTGQTEVTALDDVPVPGTPVPPVMPGDAAIGVAPGPGESMTTSLGGSNVAVSSVGEDHQVDAPGRRGNKKAKPRP